MTGRRVLAATATVLAVLAALTSSAASAPPAGSAGSRAAGAAEARRVLVFSMPGVTWNDVRDVDLPNLEAFLEDAAVASLAPARTVAHRRGPADAYLTFGAGARAVGDPPADGNQVQADEIVDGVPATEVFARRTGRRVGEGVLSLGFESLRRRNGDLPYDAQLGAVAAELEEAGVAVAVVANADGDEGPDPGIRMRQAALALTGPDGVLDRGAVRDDLLTADADAPFGVRLDPERVVAAFSGFWGAPGESVVLVEASDLARVSRYLPAATDEQWERLHERTLVETDALFGRLLGEVDPERDAVLVVGPTEGRRKLTVAALRAPGTDAGLLRTASTQRDGVVNTVDVGPTLLDLVGLDFTQDMEGRPFEVVRSGATLDARVDRLVDDAEGAARRSDRLFPVTALLVVLLGVVVAGTLFVAAAGERVPARARALLSWLALFGVAALPATLVVQATGAALAGFPAYLLVVGLLAAALGTAASFVPGPYGPVAVVLAAALGAVVVDALTGSHLHYNAVFGYSPTANSRLYGISNYFYGVVLATSLLLAALVVTVVRGRHAFALAASLLGFVLVVEGLPAWGADVGGVLAGVPTFGLFLVLVRRGRLRLRTVALGALATLGAVAVFAGIDLLRPEGRRTHLGRLVERIAEEGAGPLTSVVERKLDAAIGGSFRSLWVVAIPIGVVFLVAGARLGSKPLARVRERAPALGVAVTAIVVGAFLGSAVNDSGAIVGALVFFTATNALAWCALRAGADRVAARSPDGSARDGTVGRPEAPVRRDRRWSSTSS